MRIVANTLNAMFALIAVAFIMTLLGFFLFYPNYLMFFITAFVIEIAVAIYYVAQYKSNTIRHYFVIIDEDGNIIAVKTKRLPKTTDRSISVDLDGKLYEISPTKTYHIVSNFSGDEIKLIDVKDLKVKAESKIRQLSMLDLTVKSLSQLFRSSDLIFLLLMINIGLGLLNLVMDLLVPGG